MHNLVKNRKNLKFLNKLHHWEIQIFIKGDNLIINLMFLTLKNLYTDF